jgi:hypothetical protein
VKCNNRPDCLCEFCTGVRKKHASGLSEKDEQNKIAEDFLRSYLQTKPAGEDSLR